MKTDKRELFTGFILALILVLMLQFSSCITPAKVAKICETCPTETKDSIVYIDKEKIIYKAGALDSLMWLSTFDFGQFRDTVYKSDTIIQFKDNTWQISLLRTDNNKIKLYAKHQADSIKELKRTIENTEVKIETVVKQVKVNVPIRDGWFKFYAWFFWLVIALCVARFGWWLWKQYNLGSVKWLSKFVK